MATILSILQEVAKAPGISLSAPSSIFGSSDREAVELGILANEMAQRIAFDTADWFRLRAIGTLTGDGSATSFALPSDFKRLLRDSQLWLSTTPFVPLEYVADLNVWIERTVQGFIPALGMWAFFSNEIQIEPAPASAATIKFPYLKNAIVNTSDTAFTADSDTFVLDDRVLTRGVVWAWKAAKGLAYAEDMQDYETALARAIGNDNPTSVIRLGRPRMLSLADSVAFPGTITAPS